MTAVLYRKIMELYKFRHKSRKRSKGTLKFSHIIKLHLGVIIDFIRNFVQEIAVISCRSRPSP